MEIQDCLIEHAEHIRNLIEKVEKIEGEKYDDEHRIGFEVEVDEENGYEEEE